MPMGDDVTIQAVDATVITPGSDFGPRYRIESLLGQGGMGRVYKAYDKELDRTVAIKIVREGMVSSGDALKRFKQELVLASKISHRNILRIHDMGTVGTLRFISMAYVDGTDLQHVLRDNPKMPLERVMNFAKQIADALAAAHAEGVVHRDLKPQNLLVDKNDQIYVCDFGLAKSFEEGAIGMTRTGAFLGTPRYMSPEQVEGKPADNRADLYAYGLIMYEMVVGDVPFTGDSTLKVMYQRIQEKPKSPKVLNPSLPNWLVRLIMRCLERDPADRYQNAYEILADLQGSQSSVAGLSRAGISRIGNDTQSVVIQLPRFTERKWIPITAGVVLLLAILFAIPPIRHLIPGFRPATDDAADISPASTGDVKGIPPLSSGQFIAVLPLKVLGDQNQLGYLSQGIEEAISAKLFQVKGVRVTASEAAAKVDQSQPLNKIARQLGANMLLQGMIQGNGDKIRIILNLQNVVDGKRVWSQQFDGVPADLFTLEDQIYSQVVSAMDVKPTNEETAKAESRPTDNIGAYDLYLRGKNALRGHDQKSTQSAIDLFNEAIKSDPKFALAYAGIADASLGMYATTKDPFWTQKALSAGQQALQFNDTAPEVHSTMGSVYSVTGKHAEAIAELRRAISLAPNSDEAYRRLGATYVDGGQSEQGIQAFQKAIELNPYFWQNQNFLGDAYLRAGDYDKALEAFKKVTELEPDIDAGYENIGNVYLTQGKYEECIPYFQQALKIEPFYTTYSNLGTAYFFLKQYKNAIPMFEKAAELNPNDTSAAVNLADAYRYGGDQDKARAEYQKAVALGFKELGTNPKNSDVMAQIALSYAKTGDGNQANEFIKRARAIDPTNVNYIYDDAEIKALTGHTAEALKALQQAFENHYPTDFAAADPELSSIQKDPQFAALIKKYSGKK
jgi:serine/threonine protein kinase/tetratricopeptide (TPR) repeat protein